MRFHLFATLVIVACVSYTKCDVVEILGSVVGGIANTAGSVARGVADTTGSVFGGIVDTTGSVLDGIAHTTGTVVKGTLDTGGTVVRAVSDTVKTAAGAVSDTAKTTWNAIAGHPAPAEDESVTYTKIFKTSARNDVYGYSWTVKSGKGSPSKDTPEGPGAVDTILVT